MQITDPKNKKVAHWKKILLPALFATVVLFIGSTHFAHADVGSWLLGNIGYGVIGKIAFGIGYIWAWIGGVVIGIEAWLIGVMLGINTGVFDSQIVQTGFGISLAIANLGFVLGIIIIALATILRRESYGVKQLLWKLVVAAILVNFGLVIMAPIFGFTNSMSQYFLNCIDPTVGCNAPQGLTFGKSMNDFGQSLVGAFQPQNGFTALSKAPDTLTGTGAIGTVNPNITGAFGANAGQDLGKLMIPILSLFSVAAALTVFVITLGALLIMLFIRYVYIAILAVLMPFAWLMWVFPKLSSNWSRWWNNFIKWSFFAPIVLFFLYLAIITAKSMSGGTAIESQNFATYTSSSNFIWANISNFFSNTFSPIISTLLNQFVFVALCIGGIFAANSMGIAGADMGIKALGEAKDWAVGKAVKIGARGRSAALRKLKQPIDALRQGKVTQSLEGIPKKYGGGIIRGAVGAVTLGQAGKIETAIGRGLDKLSDNRDQVKEEKKNVPTDKKTWEKHMEGFQHMPTRQQMAYLDSEFVRPEMSVGKGKDGKDQSIESYLNEHRDDFRAFGQDGDGSLEDKLRIKTNLIHQDLDEDNEKAKEKNRELNIGKLSPEEQVQWKSAKKELEDVKEKDEKFKAKEKTGAKITDSEQQEWNKIKARQGELERKESELEKKGEETHGPFSKEDQAAYERNEERVERNERKRKGIVVKNPEATASLFGDDEKARARFIRDDKEIPPTLQKEFLEKTRTAIIKGMAEGFSGQNARVLFDGIAKADNFKNLEVFVEGMEKNKKEQWESIKKSIDQNSNLKAWMESTAGRVLLGKLSQSFGIKERRDDRDEGGDEDDKNNQPQPTPPPPNP